MSATRFIEKRVRILASDERAALVQCIETGVAATVSLAFTDFAPDGEGAYLISLPAEAKTIEAA